jgi:hypothetical protein
VVRKKKQSRVPSEQQRVGCIHTVAVGC